VTAVIERRAARALLIAEGAVLLIQGCDPARRELGKWWLTPGGGIDDGESIQVAAAREVLEETGLRLEVDQMGPVVATRVAEFEFDEQEFRQTEWFFAVTVDPFTPHGDGWEEIERKALFGYRWWTVEQLETTDELIYPIELAGLLRIVQDGAITEPIVLSEARLRQA
jgi:8-oxo-dGTP pyrophosphatase MutT (NUDIX family)